MKYQVNINGELRVLHGLTPKYQDYRNDYSPEFIKGLIRRSEAGDVKATEALLFLDAYCLAEFHSNLTPLKQLTVVSEELDKNFYEARNSHRRCVLNNDRSSKEYLPSSLPVADLGELVDGMRILKKKLRKEGKSIEQYRAEYDKRNKVNPLKKNPVLPVKRIDTIGYILAEKLGINNSYKETSFEENVLRMTKIREMSRKKLSEKDE